MHECVAVTAEAEEACCSFHCHFSAFNQEQNIVVTVFDKIKFLYKMLIHNATFNSQTIRDSNVYGNMGYFIHLYRAVFFFTS